MATGMPDIGLLATFSMPCMLNKPFPSSPATKNDASETQSANAMPGAYFTIAGGSAVGVAGSLSLFSEKQTLDLLNMPLTLMLSF
jgi:hypothetical protein